MNIVMNVVWIGLGLFLLAYSYSLGVGSLHVAGPGLMPFLIGLLLLVVSLCLGFETVMKSRTGKRVLSTDKPAEEADEIDLKKSIILIVSLILYALVMEQLGFVIATFLLLAVSFHALGVRRLPALAGSLGTVLACYFVFTYLGQRFPPGILRYLGMY